MTVTKQIPKEEVLDSTLNLLKEGYQFIPNRLMKFDTNIFETRLLGQRAIVISGADAAELFYDTERMQRKNVVPKRIQKTIFGVGGVQGMDGEAHRHRKQLFMSLMTKERINDLLEISERQWENAVKKWEQMNEVHFFAEAEKLMFRIACEWADVPLWAKELKQRAKDMGEMVDALGAVGPRYWQGRMARKRSEIWIESLIEDVRSGKLISDEKTALYQMAWHKNLHGELLNSRIAAVELINILRPIVAIARFVTFGVLALHEHPKVREKFAKNKGNYRQMFIQEVRRYYPFGPFLGAKPRYNFSWNGYEFKKGTLVVLDLYGINHSHEIWERPNDFWPERFSDWNGSPFNFIPQGGGEYDIGHRCAGEWITVEVMKKSLEFLSDKTVYVLPDQDLSYSMVRIPSIPESRIILKHVRRK